MRQWLLKHGTFSVLGTLGLVFLVVWVFAHIASRPQAVTPPSTVPAGSAEPQSTLAGGSSLPVVVPSSVQAVPSDLSQFDQAGTGDACRMHYSQTADGRTVTRFTISQAGELITHVSGPDGTIHRNDQRVTVGAWAFTYDVPLAQVADMGAVLYLADGSSQACAIGPGAMAP